MQFILSIICFSLLLFPSVLWAGEWTVLNPVVSPPAKVGAASAVFGNSLYIFGGSVDTPAPTDPKIQFGLANDLWKYSEDGWIQEIPANLPPEERSMAAMASTALKVYMFGGSNKFGAALGDLWSYNPANKSWTMEVSQGDVPPARQYHTMIATQSGQLILLGGIDAAGAPADPYLRTYLEDKKTWMKSPLPAELANVYGHSAAAVGDKMYVFGGNDAYNQDVWIYDLAQDVWTKVTPQFFETPMSMTNAAVPPRMFAAATVSRDSFYIFGGQGSGELSDVWEFNTVTQGWRQHQSMPAPLTLAVAGTVQTTNGVRHILFGGKSSNTAQNETWAFTPNIPDCKIGGKWIDAVPNVYSLGLKGQDVTGTFRVLKRNSGTCSSYWPITGKYLDGSLVMEAVNPDPTNTGCCPDIRFEGSLSSCTAGTGTWSSCAGSGTWKIGKLAVPSIRTLNPKKGDKIKRGSTRFIEWAAAGNIPKVNITLHCKNGTSFVRTVLATGLSNNGRWSWQVSPTLAAAVSCFIRVQATDNAKIFDNSDMSFSVE